MTFRQLVVVVWGGLHGAITFCLTLMIYEHPEFVRAKHEILAHVTGLLFLTLLVNATTMPVLLRVLGFSEISVAKKVKMNNCVAFLLSKRERVISILKMER